MKSLISSVAFWFCCLTIYAQATDPAFEAYLNSAKCSNTKDTLCLKETSYKATRGDGRRVTVNAVYERVGEDPNDEFFKPHFLMEYLRKLRDAYAYSTVYGDQLYNQIDFMVSRAVHRNGALVWENYQGIAQGMEQTEFADYCLSAAGVFEQHGDHRTARHIVTIALRFLRSIDIQAGPRSGGFSSVTTYCGGKTARERPCYWFHSRGVAITEPGVRTVLNQHLHVVRDLLQAFMNVDALPVQLFEGEFGSKQQVLDFIEDKAIGGLYQLAFSAGNTNANRSRPPNIRQFMSYRRKGVRSSPQEPDGNPLPYYRAFYEFDMSTGQGKDIASSCHYHTHVLNLVSGINDILEAAKALFLDTTKSKHGWRLYEARDALLRGRGEAMGAQGSTHALYQFYLSEAPAYRTRRERCSESAEKLDDAAMAFYRSRFE